MTAQRPTKAQRVTGHALRMIRVDGFVAGVGCECGKRLNEGHEVISARKWHRAHKAQVLAAAASAPQLRSGK